MNERMNVHFDSFRLLSIQFIHRCIYSRNCKHKKKLKKLKLDFAFLLLLRFIGKHRMGWLRWRWWWRWCFVCGHINCHHSMPCASSNCPSISRFSSDRAWFPFCIEWPAENIECVSQMCGCGGYKWDTNLNIVGKFEHQLSLGMWIFQCEATFVRTLHVHTLCGDLKVFPILQENHFLRDDSIGNTWLMTN